MGPQLSTADISKHDEITFTIHGKIHRISVRVVAGQRITPETSLLTYLRDIAELKETKAMCREGGCGACIVAATFIHPHTKRKVTRAVNSCLVPILACHNWEITTVHGLGNRDVGYHPIQEALAKFNGSQCGFCSSGMVMNMYALAESRDVLTMVDVEDAFGGNLCRCTGYRPIMDAFKSLAEDADPALKDKFPDIENLKICKKTNKVCEGECENVELLPFHMELGDDMHWYKVNTIQNILEFFRHIGNSTYRFVAGNTGQGVYKITDPPKYWVDIRSVKELISYRIDKNLVLGANMSLSDTMDLMQKLAEENDKFWYLKQMWNHLDLVANVPVRNIGTLAGNLSLKHNHREFPSDVFLLLETVGAEITIVRQNGSEVTKSVAEYINFDMYKCVMKSITLPPIKKDTHLFKTYKIMPRAQNAHAHVNAGFLVEHNNYKVKSARIVYGGINPNFIHATDTEKYLKDKNIFNDNVLQGVLDKLSEDLKPDYVLPDPTPEFRKNLARNLYYKFFLSTAPKGKVNPKFESGGSQLEHKLLSGVQFFQTDKSMYPVTKPVNKIEALMQCSGEAQYIDDMPPLPGQVFGAFVLAETIPLSKVKKIDTSEAMKMPGVSAFVDHNDIPGKNVFTTSKLNSTEELLFCEDVVQYNGQPLGVIVADTYECAVAAAQKVKVTYEKPTSKKDTPEYTIKSILKNKKSDRVTEITLLHPKRKGNDVKHVVKGCMTLKGQYHLTMETQRCVCVPTEDGGYDIYASTQLMDHVQMSAANALKLTMDKINVIVRRLGGGYGVKIFRATLISTACVVACHKVRRPLRLVLPLDTNMKAVGKRFPTYAEYEVGVNDAGVIQYLDSSVYQACGVSGLNEEMLKDIPHYMSSGYVTDTWKMMCSVVRTDMAGNAYCRAPGSSEAIALIENIMDHIAEATKKSLVEVRHANLETKTEDMKKVMDALVDSAEYNTRLDAVNQFNSENRWMKKGLGLVIMNYNIMLFNPYSVFIAIYAGDGSVAISHGGIEMGQGINTKVVQVCAYELGIPMDTISIKPSSSLNAPNNEMTGASITSESVCYATIQACKELLRRLEPVKAQMKNPTWKDLIWKAKQFDIELCATGIFTSTSMKEYIIPAACVSEVQVDLLTGEHVTSRVDLLEDVGQSISPAVDAGQIEGAFIMGVGNYTCEDLVYDDKDGGIRTFNTWTYKVPGVKDVPQDFRIQFRQNSTNPLGVLNSKATGEPALALAIGVPFAVRKALDAAKKDIDPKDTTFLNMETCGCRNAIIYRVIENSGIAPLISSEVASKPTQTTPVMAWMLVNPQIHNIFASLGVQQGDAYRVSEDCLTILGDILSKLSVEDRTLRTFRRAIGFGQHIRKDLLPLLIHVKDDTRTKDHTKIIDATIKILVNLTIPVECLLSMDVLSRTDVGRHTIFEINKLLYSSKEAFVDSRSIKAVTDHMKFVIERGAKLETEECDSINNCLLLLRNVLHIPEHRMQISNCPLAHSSMQNRILWNLFTQSIDKLLLHLMAFPQKIYWVITMVQLIALMYKDQHVGTLQNLLSTWFETSLSDSSDDNESNTSPPPNQASGDSSPMLTSDPTTSDSSDNAATATTPKQHVVRSQQNRNKVLLTSHKQRSSDDSSSSSSSRVPDTNKNSGSMSTSSEGCSNTNTNTSSNNNNNNNNDTKIIVQSELSDYGYVTQVENQESISTSSNEDDAPQLKPVHQKPHLVQKPRNKVRNIAPQDKKEIRRKKLIKRSKINIINIKGLMHYSPSDEDISNILKEFTVDFLLKGYGSLVHELYTQLLSATDVKIDTSHIFWLVTYFLKFATQLELEFEHLEPVLAFHILAYLVYEGVSLCEQLEVNCAQPGTDIKPCLRRMHLIVTAIKEFLQAIETYKKIPHLSKEHQDKLTQLQIQITSTDNVKCLLLLLIRHYKPDVQSRQYLQDLIITNHTLLLFLDNSSKLVEGAGINSMVEHLKHFANVEVMHQYGLLLEDFENNGKFTNDCIFTMMHHIGGDIDNVATLFQPNILKTFSKIWESDYQICDDWSDLIEYVIHKFINVPRQPSQECCSPNLRECIAEIEVCSPLSPLVEINEEVEEWTDEEIDALYWHYVQSRKTTKHVIENIEKLYIENGDTNKSRESIIRQLLFQKMITQSCYEKFMKLENINLEKINQEDQESRDILALKEQLVRENQGNAILWLQKLLLDACHCKVIINNNDSCPDAEIYEPIPYCYIKLRESIPVVSWCAELSNVLKNKSLISLLHKLGFQLPCDSRKLFVRMPNSWTAAHMFHLAQKLGPLDPANLKFDVSLLNAEDATVAPLNVEVEQLSETRFHPHEDHEKEASTSRAQSHYLLPNSPSNWFQTVLHAKLNAVLHYTHNALSCTSELTTEQCPEAVSPSPATHDDSEHNSICDTASVTSDLTRMYVSDEEDKE